MARFGNASTSSLLSAASSAADRLAVYNDSLASLEWDQSAKTQEDLSKYEQYLGGRLKTAQNTDPSKALSLTRTIDSARRSFTSSEIARAGQDIQTGSGTSADKLQKIADLYNAAYNNGDMALAQQLYGQYNTTQLSIQNQAIAAGNAKDAANTKYQLSTSSDYLARIGDVKDQIKAVDEQFKKTGKFTPTQQNGQSFIDPATGKPFSMNGLKALLYSQINDIAQEAQSAGLDPEHFRSIATSATDALNSPDYQKAIQNLNFEASGQSPQAASVTGYDDHGRPIYKASDNPQTGIAAQQNETGQFQFTPTLNTQGVSSTDLLGETKAGQDKLNQIKNSLKYDGIKFKEDNGALSIFEPNSQQWVRAVIDPTSGNLRYTTSDQGGNTYEKQVTIDSNTSRAKNDNPFSDVSFQQLQAEQNANEASQDPAVQAAQKQAQEAGSEQVMGGRSSAAITAAGSVLGATGIPGLAQAGSIVPRLLNLSNKAREDKARAAADLAAGTQAAKTLQVQSNSALSAIPRANSKLPVTYNPSDRSLQGTTGSVFKVPAATTQAALQPGTQGFANTFMPVANKSYLLPYQGQIDAQHFAIINGGTNYGGTVQSLRNAGVTDSQLATNGVYDQALRAANSSGQFK